MSFSFIFDRCNDDFFSSFFHELNHDLVEFEEWGERRIFNEDDIDSAIAVINNVVLGRRYFINRAVISTTVLQTAFSKGATK
eukprot:CAMPEP_0175081012 /NCGR_PEP_ID=MMETSP0052_2-20121109/25875_1 /TAXON_ID=51329 ORGANISM="Polytomella parva, Strain SAG 63-3" /NCGR_SAMPLE_ID=MMETSP0052_2 /ASSEMBLY_ACC=CAM_ASM_000194 /LENGTH=81 /DNA_ID=CAMNT_0016351873 /DNA_START=112 /DNA_END=357 /DNA_ORIENTATION=-